MGKTKAILAVVAVAAALIAPVSAQERDEPARADRLDRPAPLASAAAGSCPGATPEVLPTDALAGATRAALAEAPRLYEGMNSKGRYAEAAYRGMAAPVNRFYKSACPGRPEHGRRLQRRSVQVNMIFPKLLPSASMSQHWVFVARFDGEYRVWGVYR